MQSLEETFSVTLAFDDKSVALPFGKFSTFEEFYVDFDVEKTEHHCRIRLTIHPKKDMTLQSLVLQKNRYYALHERVFCNGFQSQSESREFGIDEKMQGIIPLLSSGFQHQGDYRIKEATARKGQFHSWTYSYIRSNDVFDLIGSLNEKNAFTIIRHEPQNQSLSIYKECSGMLLSHSFPILDVVLLKGKEKEVFDRYFQLMELPQLNSPLTGWSSCYSHTGGVTEEIVLKNATAFKEREIPFDLILVDDGYQKNTGDWQPDKKSFPNGMGRVAKTIRQQGFKAGIRIAPFVCTSMSAIFKNKKSWLVKNENGKPICAGYHPQWKSRFYVLDFYNPEVQKHLSSIFYTLTDKWRFDVIKADFLYAACIRPPRTKTRGQMMNDVMVFLRNQFKNQLLLAGAVPLGSAFGNVDFCRVGPEVHRKWEDRKMKWLGNRERAATVSGIKTVLGRWQLNGRAFRSDPGVFILNDGNKSLNFNQQITLLTVNTLLGSAILNADDTRNYSAEQWCEMESVFKWKNSEVQKVVDLGKDRFCIHFFNDDQNWLALINLSGKNSEFPLKKGAITLEPYESIILENR